MPLLSNLRSTFRGGYDSSLIGSALLGILIKSVSTMATFSVVVLLARSLGPTKYGTYVFALTLVSLIALPLQSGLSYLVVRETAKLCLPKDLTVFTKLLKWARGRTLAIFVVAFLIGWGGWFWLARPSLVVPGERSGVIAIGLLLILTIPLTGIQSSAVRGLGFGNLGQVPDLFVRHLSFLGLLILVLSLVSKQKDGALDPMLVMGLHVLGSAIACLVATVFLRRAAARVIKAANTEPETSNSNAMAKSDASTWQLASLALFSVAGLQLLNSSLDVVFLGWLRGDTEVGLYRVLVQMGTLVSFGLMAINPVLHGRFARLYANGEMVAMQRMVTHGVVMCLLVAILPMLVLFSYGAPVLGWLFGVEYAAQGAALKIILLGQLANVAFGAVGALLNMTGHQADTVRGMMIAVLLNLVLNLALIPSYGIVGAALATAVSTALWNALLWHIVWKRLKIDSSILGAGWRRHIAAE